MGKINKYANIYSKDGNLLRHVNEDGLLKDYTIEELEKLVDELGEDKDENGNVKDPNAFNNASAILFQMYQRHGNPHEKELLDAIMKAKEAKSTKEQVEEKLEEVAQELEEPKKELVMDEYVDFEEVA